MTTSPYTFEDLATAEAQETIRARLLASLLADGQPTASWAPSSAGGIENLRADMVAGGLAFYMAARIAAFVNGRILPLATDSAANGYFLTYLGKRFYKLVKRAPTFTIQNILLANVGSTQEFHDGDLWVASPATGNKYRLTLPPDATISVPQNGFASAPFYAENAGARYSDGSGTVSTMVTAKAGITCLNRRDTDYAPTRSTGDSSGIIGGFSSTTPAYSVLRFRINTSGNVGGGSFSWSIDGGLTWTPGGPIPSLFIVPGGAGGNITFTNGGASPSFIAGSIFTLAVNDNFIQRGADAESDADFRERCANRHPGRSLIPLKAHIELWAHEASAEVNKISSDADPNTPGGILVTIASSTGPATPGAQAAVEDFISTHLMGFKGVPAPVSPAVLGSRSPEETVLVSSAIQLQVQASATVYMPRAQLAAAQAAADQLWNDYLASLPLGGRANALVELERFYTILGDLGADDVQDLTLNDVAADLTIPVGRVAVPKAGWTLLANLSWVAV